MRSLTERPSASEISVTLHRFGRNRRLVLILEWLTLWPTWGPLAVSSQRRDMAKILCHPRTGPKDLRAGHGGSKSRPFQEPRTYRAAARRRQDIRPVEMRGKADKTGVFAAAGLSWYTVPSI